EKRNLITVSLPDYFFRNWGIIGREINLFWEENPVFQQLLQHNSDLESIRKRVFNYLAEFDRKTLQNHYYVDTLDRNIARKCINVLKNIFSKRSEDLTGFSALETMVKLEHQKEINVSLGFVCELRKLFLGMKGNTGLNDKITVLKDAAIDDFPAAPVRIEILNEVAEKIKSRVAQYRSGLEDEIISVRKQNVKRIVNYFEADSKNWNDWHWQSRHTIRDARTLGDIIDLTPRERVAIEKAWAGKLPFGITPYYASLMDKLPDRMRDHAVRAQVIPPPDYVENVLKNKEMGLDMDFMGEKETSPVDLVTRRYPGVAILKPFNTCAQICVYCQRNWEIDDCLSDAAAPGNKLERALDWFRQNTSLEEVLITGGDPGIMSDALLSDLLTRLAEIKHLRRIRIGTRVPVVLPMRVTAQFADLLARFIEPGKRELSVMTHFEHPYEVTPDSLKAVQTLRSGGIPVYNQTVFTVENSRRFEMTALRRTLRKIGVEPYYTFNTKGKDETKAYRVPVARLIQEQTEEARLSPGLDRTDEAVFNIPRLGKSYLRAGQDHDVIMIMSNGCRVYEFYPWDQGFSDTKPYLYEDVSIFDYLSVISGRGEDPQEYGSIWYYF
ncbi:MAG TPA: KamA family radical SAM protein, partial [Desulfobacteria bacterium]|nr:KamA family radical SAM protein [Desulfobacteria bacterium]